jgi:gluconolactonase
MQTIIIGILLAIFSNISYSNEVISGFKMPESVAEGPDGSIYLSEIGERDKDKDGKITKIDKNGVISTVAEGLYDPKGIVFYNNKLYVTDRDAVIEVNLDGSWGVYAGTMSFPKTPVFLNDIDVSKNGDLYVTDTGDFKTSGFVFLIKRTGKVSVLFEGNSKIKAPNGILPIPNSRLLVLDWGGDLLEANLINNKIKKIASGFDGGDGLAYTNGVIYISSWKEGIVYSHKNGATKIIDDNYKAAADIALSRDKKTLIVPDMKSGTVTLIKIK